MFIFKLLKSKYFFNSFNFIFFLDFLLSLIIRLHSVFDLLSWLGLLYYFSYMPKLPKMIFYHIFYNRCYLSSLFHIFISNAFLCRKFWVFFFKQNYICSFKHVSTKILRCGEFLCKPLKNNQHLIDLSGLALVSLKQGLKFNSCR